MRSCPRSRQVVPMPHEVPKPADQATKQQGNMGHATAEVGTVLIGVAAAACEEARRFSKRWKPRRGKECAECRAATESGSSGACRKSRTTQQTGTLGAHTSMRTPSKAVLFHPSKHTCSLIPTRCHRDRRHQPRSPGASGPMSCARRWTAPALPSDRTWEPEHATPSQPSWHSPGSSSPRQAAHPA